MYGGLISGLKQNCLLYVRALILLGFGLAYVFILPPFEAPDEPAHFARAYSIAEGQVVIKDHPRDLVVFVKEAIEARLEARNMKKDIPVLVEIKRLLDQYDDRIPNIAFNAAQYSPVPYIFHAAAIRLVMLFDSFPRGFLLSLYACRVVSLLMFVGLLYLSFSLFPSISWPLFWLSITPMALSQASVVSVDYIVFLSCAILLAASLGDLRRQTYSLCLIPAAFFLLLTRPPYLWLLIIPVVSVFLTDSEGRTSRVRSLIVAVTLALAGAFIWNWFAKSTGIYDATIAAIRRYLDPAIDPLGQLDLILRHPVSFFEVMLRTFLANSTLYYHQFVGVLGWLDTPVPFRVAVAWGVLAVVPVVISDVPSHMGYRNSSVLGIVCVGAAVLSAVSVFISMYIIWTPVGCATGYLQGRYLHPVAAAVLVGAVLMKPFDVGYQLKRLGACVLLLGAAGINAMSILTVVERYGSIG